MMPCAISIFVSFLIDACFLSPAFRESKTLNPVGTLEVMAHTSKTELKTSLPELEELFRRLQIDTSILGFYDDPGFLWEESATPDFLENYAAFVQLKKYDESYLRRATVEIPFICNLLYNELVNHGQFGASIDISFALVRILEAEGFWNYIVNGSSTIEFQSKLKLKPRYFWSFNVNPEPVGGHTWIVAPPFNIIDLTLKQQPYAFGEEKWLPDTVITKDFKIYKPREIDLISPDLSLIMNVQGNAGSNLSRIKTNYSVFARLFKPNQIETGDLKIKYIPAGLSVPEEPLDKIISPNLNGKPPFEFYQEVIKPALKELREMK
ncbi:hypothetical protein [Mucilaginibacter paludis]|uniref:Uncharacterized protein n=1 Tax=Mucilaginibacter paludis DSM 18603 TaxID=714943 RepID=H1YHK5_9SPHI|nr:hypothetical protein [Mucilaginibacter paludis]EHQ26428.1 hypothetical protein Mucpa_2296 [Mucilaginibacter paludis DSM 18603]